MSEIDIGDVVKSIKGRDRGNLYYVLSIQDRFAYLVDGKQRKTDRPKKKNKIHIEKCEMVDMRINEKLKNGEYVSNTDIRKSLSRLRTVFEEEQEEK